MSFALQSDKFLLGACHSGQIAAYEEIFLRYSGRLFNFALKYARDTAIAEELMMDVLFWVWQNREQLDEVQNLAPYLFRAMRNKVFNHLRIAALQTTPLEALVNDITDGSTPEHVISLTELKVQYQESLERLNPKCRNVFLLSREDQMSYAEISAHLNISVKTVEGHISNALKFLRKDLSHYSGAA